MPFGTTRRGLCAAALGLAADAGFAARGAGAADALPPGNVRIIVPIAPGGPLDALARLLADEPRRQALGAAARRIAKERYSWDTIAGRLLEVYELALGRRAPAKAVAA